MFAYPVAVDSPAKAPALGPVRQYRRPRRVDTTAHRRLAATVIAGCVEALRRPCPTDPNGARLWAKQRAKELTFIADPRLSAFWCEAAGVEWDVVVSKLDAAHLLAAA